MNTRYIYGAFGELIAQFGGSTVDYWNISGPIGETIGRKGQTPPIGIGDVISMKSGTYVGYMRYYYLKDHLGSVRVTLNQNGSVVGHDDYYPFGLQMPGRSNNSANRDDDQKFTGHFLEQEGDLEIYHAQARMYDPAIGRFMGVDAMRGLYPSFNSYNYAMNNPTLYVDLTGNCAALESVQAGEGASLSDWQQCADDLDPPNTDTKEENLMVWSTSSGASNIRNNQVINDAISMLEEKAQQLDENDVRRRGVLAIGIRFQGQLVQDTSLSYSIVLDRNGNIALIETTTIGVGYGLGGTFSPFSVTYVPFANSISELQGTSYYFSAYVALGKGGKLGFDGFQTAGTLSSIGISGSFLLGKGAGYSIGASVTRLVYQLSN